MTKFRVESAFTISLRNILVFEGEVEDGTLSIGMKIKHPLLKVTYLVNSIESIRKVDKEKIGLTVKLSSTEELKYLNLTDLCGEILVLS